MTRLARGALIAVSLAIAASARADMTNAPSAALDVSELRLGNGLAVVLAPDDTASSVAVHVRYAFGAADEGPREEGFAHLLERLLASGSVHVADPDAMLDAVGGWTTSATAADHVSVTDVVPAGALERALWLEADRMAGAAEAIDDAGLARALAAIAAERRSAYDDHPYALVARAIEDALGQGHVLGDPHATRAALAAFTREHVAPANATLVIAGRFDPAATRAVVERDFAWIPAGPRPRLPTSRLAARQAAVRREVADPIAKVVVAARGPLPYSGADLALELAMQIVAGGRTSRIGQRLGGAATDVRAELTRDLRGDVIQVVVTVARADDLDRTAAVIASELAALRDVPVTSDELARARAALDLRLVTGLEGLAFRADMLATWASYLHRPASLEPVRHRRAAITPAEVLQAAVTWLGPTSQVTVIGRGAP